MISVPRVIQLGKLPLKRGMSACVLMTSFAFVLGVMPLLFATGAGAQSRIALGAAVVFGMAMNTLLATIYIPNFYEFMQKLQERFSKKKGNEDSEKDVAV